MEANELRIGNYFINPNGQIRQISYHEIRILSINTIKINYKPIPLTEEWLLKFGFIHAHTCWYEKGLLDTECWFLTFNITSGGKVTLSTDREEHFLRTIEYVHQLQNLYFALTQKELQIK